MVKNYCIKAEIYIWRAPISNDMEIIDEMKKKYFLHLEYEIVRSFEWKKVDDFIQVIVKQLTERLTVLGIINAYQYLIAPNGEIFFDLKGSPAGKIENAPDMLPRLGVTLHLDKSLSKKIFR